MVKAAGLHVSWSPDTGNYQSSAQTELASAAASTTSAARDRYSDRIEQKQELARQMKSAFAQRPLEEASMVPSALDTVQVDLFRAVETGNLTRLSDLVVEHGVEVLKRRRASDGESVCNVAASIGSIDMLKYLVDMLGPQVLVEESNMATPAHRAARNTHRHILDYIATFHGIGALQIANRNGVSTEFVIISKDLFDPPYVSPGAQAIYAARSGDVELLKRLVVKHGQSILTTRDPNNDGASLVHDAAFNGHVLVLKYLASELGPQILRDPNADGDTPAHWAAVKGHRHVLEYYVDQFDPEILDAKNSLNKTVAEWAVEFGHMTEPVTTVGAQARRAAYFGNVEALQALVEREGIDILEMANIYGRTPAHQAALKGHLNVLSYIVETAPSKTRVLQEANIDGDTAATYAAINAHLGALKYIKGNRSRGWLN